WRGRKPWFTGSLPVNPSGAPRWPVRSSPFPPTGTTSPPTPPAAGSAGGGSPSAATTPRNHGPRSPGSSPNWPPLPSRPSAPAPPDVTDNGVPPAFGRHAEDHYRRPDGTATNELKEYRLTLQPLRSLYGHTPAAEFDPRALQAVRRAMVESGLARTTIN